MRRGSDVLCFNVCKVLITLHIFLMSGWERGAGREVASGAGEVYCMQLFVIAEQFRTVVKR